MIGFEGLYECSTWGRVKSLARMRTIKNGGLQPIPERIITLQMIKVGRLVAHLHKNYKQTCFLIHRLVLLTFVGPCPEGMECCHADDDCSNNHLENLRWNTKDNNIKEASKNGKIPLGTKHWNHKLTEVAAREVKRRADAGECPNKLAIEFDVSPTTIYDVRDGRTWKHLFNK